MHNETLSIAAMCVCIRFVCPLTELKRLHQELGIDYVCCAEIEAAEPLKKSSYNTNIAVRA